MLYFAYDHLASRRQLMRWYGRSTAARLPEPGASRPAVLKNYRLSFPLYSEGWVGGVADVAHSPGKSVGGALVDLPERAVAALDEQYGRALDWAGRERGAYRLARVVVHPYGPGPPVDAVTHQVNAPPRQEYAPSRRYVDLLLDAAYELGLSTLWISYVSSIPLAAPLERLCRPHGDGGAPAGRTSAGHLIGLRRAG